MIGLGQNKLTKPGRMIVRPGMEKDVGDEKAHFRQRFDARVAHASNDASGCPSYHTVQLYSLRGTRDCIRTI